MKKITKISFAVAAILLFSPTLFAQQKKQQKEFLYSNRVSVLAGLIQPMLLKGENVEITYFSKKMSFDYSHGFSLDMAGSTITGNAKTQKLAYHLPFSTGFGIGYRFTSFLDLRIEQKMHSWEVYYDGEVQSKATLIKKYKTYTVGLGAYYRYMPFKNKANWLQGVTTSSSVRWWPNVSSSLTDDKFTYNNKYTNRNETLKAANIGIAGTQFLVNISVGYTFGGK